MAKLYFYYSAMNAGKNGSPATISVSFDGVPTDVAFTTTGTLSVDGQGELVVAVDAP